MSTIKNKMFRGYCFGYLSDRSILAKLWKESGLSFSTYKEYKIDYTLTYLGVGDMSKSRYRAILKLGSRLEIVYSMIMIVKEYVDALIKKIKVPDVNIPEGRIIFIDKGLPRERFEILMKKTDIDMSNLTIISLSNKTSYNNYENYPVLSFLGLKEISRSFLYSFSFLFFFHRRYGNSDVLFRSYSAFAYFLTFFLVEKCMSSNTFLFFDNYSRWAHIYNELNVNHIWVQHGIEEIDEIVVKLSNISNNYYISKKQKDICEKVLFGHITIAHYQKNLELTGKGMLLNNGKMNVMLVCNHLFWTIEKEIIKWISKKGINIYLKPFPKDVLDDYNRIATEYDNVLVIGRYDYPEVDLVISYSSTLADEYEDNDIEVLRYYGTNASLVAEGIYKELEIKIGKYGRHDSNHPYKG